MSLWLEAARAASMPVQLGQKGAVRSETKPIGVEKQKLSVIRDLSDPNRPNCTSIETETPITGAGVESPGIEICDQCAVIVKEGQEFLHIVADGFPGVIHLACYDAWYDGNIRGRYPGS